MPLRPVRPAAPEVTGWPHRSVANADAGIGRVAESFHWVKALLDTAKATGDPDLLIAGHATASAYYFWIGRPKECVERGDQVLALYDGQKHRDLVHQLNQDPKTRVGCYSSVCTWMLGYPDRAVRLVDETDSHARRRAHPFDLGFALLIGAWLFDFHCEPKKMRKRADECGQLGRDNSLPLLWSMFAPQACGVALIREGKAAEGISSIKAGLKVWDTSGGGVRTPYLQAVLAEGMARLGDLDGALELVDKAIAQIERPG